ncbi:DNA internalization-related competence protein ComEC/Rec2 [Sinorhizobium sojae CCBAU 05684]|uniref:DNA internalization-related competence protein ComEC/Rec2 n=1 Tax=Sinorhizobium sojae CCBAU 05684 TaxID=716928 RepID=A0A249PC16_9HYPH|nr:DNA internalization-related competence protein ComEC/Rec2 [Sinorhizobium sojae CCBAU 05684]
MGEMTLSLRAAAYLAEMRESIGSRIRSTIGGDTGAMAAALVTDEERAIGRETVEVLRAAGLAHVLAISGMNMVLVTGTFLVGARTLLSLVPGLAERLPIKKMAAAGALLMVLLYILISGGAVSALRSWIMISIMLLAVFFDRVSISLRNVALAALVIIAWTPSSVAGPGFQMSFAATLALVAGYARWRDHRAGNRERALTRSALRPAGNLVVGTVATSLIGGLATAIYAAAHFHRLPAYGLAANVVATPLIGILIMPFGLFAMLLMPFGLEHYPLMVMAQGLDWMLEVARYVAALDGDWATGRVGEVGFVSIAFGGVLLCVLRTRLAFAGFGLVLLGGTAIALERQAEHPSIAISEDGRLVGLISDESIATNRPRPPHFVFSQWQRALALEKHAPPVAATATVDDIRASAAEARAILASVKPGVFHCRKGEWCVGRSREGWAVVVIDAADFFPALCGGADLVIAATRRPLADCPAGGALVVTGEMLRRSGSIEIHAEPAGAGEPARMRIVESFPSTQRPWQRHRRYDWRSGTFSSE